MRIGLLFALAASLIACRGQAPSQRGHERPAPAEVAPWSRTLSIDSGTPASELAGVSDQLRNTVLAINSVLPGAVRAHWQIIGTTDNQPLELRVNGQRALRLEPDASVTGAPNVIGGSSMEQAADPLHVGVLAVRFGDCRALAEAKAKVERSGRKNFALPVLTLFRTRTCDHSLVFVFSETPTHKSVTVLLRDTNALLRADLQCSR